MASYATPKNIEKVFELISEGTMHKKNPIASIDGIQINIEGLLKELCSKCNVKLEDFKVDNILYTISMKITSYGTTSQYYLYPLYDSKETDNKFCVYALSKNILTNGKVFKSSDINQASVNFVSRQTKESNNLFLYIKINKSNSVLSDKASNTDNLLLDGWLNNSMSILTSIKELTSITIKDFNFDKYKTYAELIKPYADFSFSSNDNAVSSINIIN